MKDEEKQGETVSTRRGANPRQNRFRACSAETLVSVTLSPCHLVTLSSHVLRLVEDGGTGPLHDLAHVLIAHGALFETAS